MFYNTFLCDFIYVLQNKIIHNYNAKTLSYEY